MTACRKGVAFPEGIQRDVAACAAVYFEGVKDGLQEQASRVGNNRGNHVTDWGDVRHFDRLSMADECVEVHGDYQRIFKVIGFFQGVCAARSVPYVPLINRDGNRLLDVPLKLHGADQSLKNLDALRN